MTLRILQGIWASLEQYFGPEGLLEGPGMQLFWCDENRTLAGFRGCFLALSLLESGIK